jgi:hypothetical protein
MLFADVEVSFLSFKKDTVARAIHHVATVTLVFASAHFGCTIIGGAVMYFFDWADSPMMIGNLIKIRGYEEFQRARGNSYARPRP